MPRWSSVVLAAVLGTAGTLVQVPPAAASGPPVRLQAEHATLGSACGDGQAQTVHTITTGETLVFLGGSSCTLTFGSTIDEGAIAVRWFGGGTTGTVCGKFAVSRDGTELGRTPQTCSVAGGATPDFEVAAFPFHRTSPGQFQLTWIPDTWWQDAHVDWLDLADDLIVREAENGTFGGTCDGQPVEAHPAPTGETVVTLGGTGCRIQFGTAGPNWVFDVRWYAGGSTLVCGHFSARYFSIEHARTRRTCSNAGGLPDFEVATFTVNDMPSFFHLVWVPEVATADAHVDWVSTGWTNGTAPAAEVTPATIDFGMRAVGSSTDRAVTVRSIGTGPMFVAESRFWDFHSGTTFTIPVDNCAAKVLWPGQSCTVVVRFTPDWAGQVTDSVRVFTAEGMYWTDLVGDADEWAPESAFTTGNGAVIPSTGTVAGTATDERSGVAQVKVAFTDLAGRTTEATATTSCNAARLSCSWSAPVPLAPGRYTVTSTAYDRVGHVESPPPSITVTVV